MSSDNKQLKISSNSNISIFGDIDVLLHLNMHKTSLEFFETNTNDQLKKYIPSTFVNTLKNNP